MRLLFTDIYAIIHYDQYVTWFKVIFPLQKLKSKKK